MTKIEKFKNDYKRGTLVRIIAGLKAGTWTRDESRIFANSLIAIFKDHEEKSFLNSISRLSRTKEDIVGVFIMLFSEYERDYRENSLSTVRSSITAIGRGGDK